MPIHEYACKACGHHFELLLLPSTKAAPECPECHSQELERLLSGFAVNSPEMSRARVRAARKQFVQSKDYKDKQVAEAEHEREHAQEHLPPKG
jgi:putative FmdB family regulatory protein